MPIEDDEVQQEAIPVPNAVAAAAKAAKAAAKAMARQPVSSEVLVTLITYALVSAVVCEVIQWFLVYRKEDYKRLKENFRKASKRLEKKKEEAPLVSPKGKGKDKKLVQLEREFEIANRDLMAIKSRTGMLTAIIHFLTFWTLKSSYDGIVVARLPFTPPGFIQNLSHRNLPGTDPRDCGMIFVYALCSLCIKPNLERALGHAPPKTQIPKGIERLAERWTGVTKEELGRK